MFLHRIKISPNHGNDGEIVIGDGPDAIRIKYHRPGPESRKRGTLVIAIETPAALPVTLDASPRTPGTSTE